MSEKDLQDKVQILEGTIKALKDLLAIKDQTIQALHNRPSFPIFQPVPMPSYPVPYHPPIITTPGTLPWPGYPHPYVGDLPGSGIIVTCEPGKDGCLTGEVKGASSGVVAIGTTAPIGSVGLAVNAEQSNPLLYPGVTMHQGPIHCVSQWNN